MKCGRTASDTLCDFWRLKFNLCTPFTTTTITIDHVVEKHLIYNKN